MADGIDYLKSRIRDSYQKDNEWKDASDKLFTPEKARELYIEMRHAGFIPESVQNFVFVSPSANIPTHEKMFFEEDKKTREGRGMFLVGDIAHLNLDLSHIQKFSSDNHFQYFQWDAERLPIKNGTVDMLWDHKGWLWFSCRAEDPNRFFSSLDQYYKLLRENGCIVIDDIGWFKDYLEHASILQKLRERFVRNLKYKYDLGNIQSSSIIDKDHRGQSLEYEPSTVDRIQDLNIDAWEKIVKKFDMAVVGSGAGRVMVLRKRG
ncbi:MAG: hypothetical protein AAB798_00425 [Patescibacteria group bacterium]